jgi:hypothetical protein
MHTNLNLGDLLYRSKSIAQHAAVYLWNGQVLHTSPDNGVEIITVEVYAKGQEIKVVKSTNVDSLALHRRLHLILNSDRRYSVSTKNCEHIANFLITGQERSPQIQASMAGALIGGITAWKAGSNHWFSIAIAGGIAGCLLTNLTRKYCIVLPSREPVFDTRL